MKRIGFNYKPRPAEYSKNKKDLDIVNVGPVVLWCFVLLFLCVFKLLLSL